MKKNIKRFLNRHESAKGRSSKSTLYQILVVFLRMSGRLRNFLHFIKLGWILNLAGTTYRRLRRWAKLRGEQFLLRVSDLEARRSRPRSPEAEDVREVSRSEQALLEALFGRDNMTAINRRFAAGDRCWGSFYEGRLVGYLWATQNDQYDTELEHKVRVPPGETYFYDCYVIPIQRGEGRMQALIEVMLVSDYVRPAASVFCQVNARNAPMLKVMEKIGFRAEEKIIRSSFAGVWSRTSREVLPRTEPTPPPG
ncbi:MAG: GNAT family N-acetyltransferase [Candidatus Firestonebacteria bacterium]|nr:GNAT family N-acetyltransferase [Candidatus Firestonebacteria bacterium]